MPAKIGDKVKIHFTGKTADGDIFATSHDREPLEFEIGGGALLPGVESAVEGMEKGEKKDVTLPPEQSFGHHHDELIILVNRSEFPENFQPSVGLEFEVPQPDGSAAYFKILEIKDEKVKLDGNHPLAGQTLKFELELLEISA
ncbi:MAG: peptidylprolyl isomerase [Chlamydiales bacterium]|nr:peptidylprolyl isomerase [Chlamydiales bacterium]